MTTEILTPVGRLVQGSLTKGYDKDAEGRPLKTQAGNPRVKYFMALAIPKTDASINAIFQAIATEARISFPTLFDANGNCSSPLFAWKYTDGDTKPEKEGFAGHWIFNFSGGYAPTIYNAGGKGIKLDADTIKCGHYIRIAGTIAGNDSSQRPGVYLNPKIIEFIGYGAEIVQGMDGASVFGGTPATVPSYVQTTPTAPTGSAMYQPQQQQAPAPAYQPPWQPQQQQAPAVAPHPGFLNTTPPYVNNNND